MSTINTETARGRDPRHTYLVGARLVKAYCRGDVERVYPDATIRLVIDGSFDGLKNMSLKSPELVK